MPTANWDVCFGHGGRRLGPGGGNRVQLNRFVSILHGLGRRELYAPVAVAQYHTIIDHRGTIHRQLESSGYRRPSLIAIDAEPFGDGSHAPLEPSRDRPPRTGSPPTSFDAHHAIGLTMNIRALGGNYEFLLGRAHHEPHVGHKR